MSVVKNASVAAYGTLESPTFFLDVIAQGNNDRWVLNLPPRLRVYQNEIEALLGKVFSGRPKSPDNLELAQQMTLNWCISKCSKIGIKFDDSFASDC